MPMFGMNTKYQHNQCVVTSTDVDDTVFVKVSCKKFVSMFFKIYSVHKKLASLI